MKARLRSKVIVWFVIKYLCTLKPESKKLGVINAGRRFCFGFHVLVESAKIGRCKRKNFSLHCFNFGYKSY